MKSLEELIGSLNILYEDNHIIIVEKFRDVLSQKDDTGDDSMVEIIKGYLKVKYNKPGNVYLGLIHRLDRRVGGVMVFAKTSKAASRLSEQIANHELEKYYLALVDGIIDKDGEIKILLEKTKDNLAVVSKNGKEAKLEYRVLKTINDNTLVEVNLITGRYNQIRASFAHIGHPIVNDYKYSKKYKVNNQELGLYCYKVRFSHPVTKELIEVTNYPSSNLWK